MDEFTSYPGDLLQHLASFVVLATRVQGDAHGAYQNAASDLSIDVSVLRRRMQLLVRFVGAPLIEGRGARLRLTTAGERVLETGARNLIDLQRLRQSVAALPTRAVVGSAAASALQWLVPGALATTRREHPAADLRVRYLSAGTTVIAALQRGDIDIALVRAKEPPAELASQRLGSHHLWLAAPVGHDLVDRRRLTARDLAEQSLIDCPADAFVRELVRAQLLPLGGEIVAEAPSVEAALTFVAEGLGVALLSSIDPPTSSATSVVEVTRLFSAASYWLLWRDDRELRAAELALIEALVDRAKRLR